MRRSDRPGWPGAAELAALALLTSGCAHRLTTWTEEPSALVRLGPGSVAVTSDEAACARVAEELRRTLAQRHDVDDDGAVRLVVGSCGAMLPPDSRDGGRGGSGGGQHHDVLVEQRVGATVTVHWPEAEPAVLSSVISVRGDDLDELLASRSVATILAWDLAQQVAPVPEERRRRVYRRAAPGSAEHHHNEAVDAERAGALAHALELAREAYVARPSWAALHYVRDLEQRVERNGAVADGR